MLLRFGCVLMLWGGFVWPALGGSLQNTPIEKRPKNLWSRSGADWPRFLGPNSDGQSEEKVALTDWTEGRLKVRWTLDAGEGYAIGSVADGRFFHFGHYGDQAILRCLNAESGQPIWDYRYESKYEDWYQFDGGPRTSPVIDGDRVYVLGVEGELHCVRINSGQRIWSIDTSQQYGVVQNFFGVGGTPLVFEDLILVMIGGSGDKKRRLAPGRMRQLKSNGSGIVAFDKRTGKEVYQAVDDLASYSSLKLIDTESGSLVLAWMREQLHGFDPRDGKVKFSFPFRAAKLESVNAMTPVDLGGGKVFISESYGPGSLLLDISDAQPVVVHEESKVRKKWLSSHWATPVVDGDHLFCCSGQHSGTAELRCLNWRTGEIKWAQPGLGRSSVTGVDGHLIVVTEDGGLLLVDRDFEKFSLITEYSSVTADPKSKFDFVRPCWSGAVVSHGLMWVRGKKKLACFDLGQ